MKKSVDVVILGAKPVKGMKSMGAFSNLMVGKKQTILDLQLFNLKKKLKIKNIIYVGGFQGSKIASSHKNVIVVDNPDYEHKNNGFNLKLAMPHLSADYLILLFHKTVFSHRIFNRLDYDRSCVFIEDSQHNQYALGCAINDTSIENIFYNLPNKLCGIYGIAKKELDILKTLKINDHFFIFEIINEIIKRDGLFFPREINDHKQLMMIDNNVSFKKLKRYYVQNFSV